MKPTGPESAGEAAGGPILAPGHTYGSVTEKISAIVLNTPLVTDANVAQWYVTGTTSSSTGNASGPTSLNVLPASELAEVVG